MITGDFETYSESELKKVGSYVYAAHPSTGPFCLAFAFDRDEEVHLWTPGFEGVEATPPDDPAVLELHERVLGGELFEAHNAFFERCVWHHVMVARFGWPAVDPSQWRCSAAKCAAFALPRNLEDAAKALRLPVQKDMAGNRLLHKLSKPRKPLKAERKAAGARTNEEFYLLHGALWHRDPADVRRLFDYCRQDVRTERAVSAQLRNLSARELAVWQLDQRMNWRGVHCDRAMVRKALELTGQETAAADAEIAAATGGEVDGHSKRKRLLEWCESQSVFIPDTRAETVDEWVERDDVPRHVADVLRTVRRVNRTSTAKYRAMALRMAGDDRIRDILRYHGASTGRWAGAGIQPQNFPRGEVKGDMEDLCSDVLRFDRDELELLHGDVMALLSTALRGALCAPTGREFVCADFSAIEARGTFWLAGDRDALRVFETDQCIYKDLAGTIFGLDDPQSLPKDSDERQAGKAGILGLGYQMGPPKFQSHAATVGVQVPMDEEVVLERIGRKRFDHLRRKMNAQDFAKAVREVKLEVARDVLTANDVVYAYRSKYHKVVALWREMERAAVEAVRRGPGAEPVTCSSTAWGVRGRFLHCRLPSGRLLSYCDPWLEESPTPWGGTQPKLRFMGVDGLTHKWSRQSTYGGKLVENVVQALCRDLMDEAMRRIDALGGPYEVLLTVHDEVLAEVDEGAGCLREFENVMAQVPAWAKGMPVAAEGWRGRRYHK